MGGAGHRLHRVPEAGPRHERLRDGRLTDSSHGGNEGRSHQCRGPDRQHPETARHGRPDHVGVSDRLVARHRHRHAHPRRRTQARACEGQGHGPGPGLYRAWREPASDLPAVWPRVWHGLRHQHDPHPLVRRGVGDGGSAEHGAAVSAAVRHGPGMGGGLQATRARLHGDQPARHLGVQRRRVGTGRRLCHRRARAHDQCRDRHARRHQPQAPADRRTGHPWPPRIARLLLRGLSRVYLHHDRQHDRAARRHHHRVDLYRLRAGNLDFLEVLAGRGDAAQGVSLRRRRGADALDRHLPRRHVPGARAAPTRAAVAGGEGGRDPSQAPHPAGGADRVPRGALRRHE